MHWTTATLFFPPGRIDPEFVEEYLRRYTVDTFAGDQYIDGMLVTLSPAERDYLLATIFPDDFPLTRYRKASVFDGTLTPLPVYDPPLGEDEDPAGREPIGHTIRCCWPETFLADLANPDKSQEDAILFDGVAILS